MEERKMTEESTKTKVFTREEVAEHKTEGDCWLILHGNVYDVTKYLDEHPGGPEIIADNAGGDATDEFEDTGHSEDARETLKKYLVGTVEGGAKSKPQGAAGAGGDDTPSFLLVLAILLALILGAYLMYQ